MVKKAFSAVLTVLALICSAFLPSFAAQSGKIDFNNPDFIRGMDISSVLSLEQSGLLSSRELSFTMKRAANATCSRFSLITG